MKRLAAATILGSAALFGQWISQPAVGIPRSPDGKPNLAAPTPHGPDGKPDLSGLWNKSFGQYATDIAAGLKPDDLRPWVRVLYQQRIDNYAKDNMAVHCLPEGPRYATRSGYIKMIHTPALLVILHEDLTYRQVHLDGRDLPKDPNPNWMGYSIGRWDGDTLVVTTSGFNARSWLDGTGHPNTEGLRLTERYSRTDFGHLSVDVTLDDPDAYTKPWTVKATATLQPDTDLIEYVCAESNGELEHMVGDVGKDRDRSVQVDPTLLPAYTGNYQLSIDGTKLLIEVTLQDDHLMINRGGRGAQPMIPLSQTLFTSTMGTYEFQKDNEGKVTSILYRQVESDVRGPRLPQ